MKKLFFILSLALSLAFLPLIGTAQNDHKTLPTDTTVIIKGRKYIIKEADKKLNIKVYGKTQRGDTIQNDMIYEATYNDEQTTEKRFEFSMPFQRKQHRSNYVSVLTGVYIGYSQLNKGAWKHSDAVDYRASKTWEIGLGIMNTTIYLDKEGDWTMGLGLDWGYRSFRLIGNNVFKVVNGYTTVEPGTDTQYYASGRLRYNFLRMPIRINRCHLFGERFSISLGIEPEWRYRIKSMAEVNGSEYQTIDTDLNVNPIGVNLIAEIRYSNIGLYFRNSLTKLINKNKGIEMYPLSFGIVWHW
jgi:hypothetical protein